MRLLIVFLLGWTFQVRGAETPPTHICFGEQCIKLEIAGTPEQRSLGLMHRKHLERMKGLLMVYEGEERASIWMKNMHFPLDLIWLDKDARVVHLEEKVPPCGSGPCPGYAPEQPGKYVLEVPAGTIESMGLRTGSKARFVTKKAPVLPPHSPN